jgi:hypothetical protein
MDQQQYLGIEIFSEAPCESYIQVIHNKIFPEEVIIE